MRSSYPIPAGPMPIPGANDARSDTADCGEGSLPAQPDPHSCFVQSRIRNVPPTSAHRRYNLPESHHDLPTAPMGTVSVRCPSVPDTKEVFMQQKVFFQGKTRAFDFMKNGELLLDGRKVVWLDDGGRHKDTTYLVSGTEELKATNEGTQKSFNWSPYFSGISQHPPPRPNANFCRPVSTDAHGNQTKAKWVTAGGSKQGTDQTTDKLVADTYGIKLKTMQYQIDNLTAQVNSLKAAQTTNLSEAQLKTLTEASKYRPGPSSNFMQQRYDTSPKPARDAAGFGYFQSPHEVLGTNRPVLQYIPPPHDSIMPLPSGGYGASSPNLPPSMTFPVDGPRPRKTCKGYVKMRFAPGSNSSNNVERDFTPAESCTICDEGMKKEIIDYANHIRLTTLPQTLSDLQTESFETQRKTDDPKVIDKGKAERKISKVQHEEGPADAEESSSSQSQVSPQTTDHGSLKEETSQDIMDCGDCLRQRVEEKDHLLSSWVRDCTRNGLQESRAFELWHENIAKD